VALKVFGNNWIGDGMRAKLKAGSDNRQLRARRLRRLNQTPRRRD
jgi:hypothetical protein